MNETYWLVEVNSAGRILENIANNKSLDILSTIMIKEFAKSLYKKELMIIKSDGSKAPSDLWTTGNPFDRSNSVYDAMVKYCDALRNYQEKISSSGYNF